MTDYAVRCYDCNRLYAPLDQSAACQVATDHCENHEHGDVHALPFKELMPLIGTFERGD